MILTKVFFDYATSDLILLIIIYDSFESGSVIIDDGFIKKRECYKNYHVWWAR